MTRLVFRYRDGRPVADAVVAITTAPAEMTDLGYVTGDDGSISLTLPAAGSYGFTLTAPNGGTLIASKQLSGEGTVELTAHEMG